MVTKEIFNQAIESGNFSLITNDDLVELLNQFPYSSILQQIRLKNLKNDFQYETLLKKAAIQSPDRSTLFDFIFSEILQATVHKVEDEIKLIENQSNSINEEKVEETNSQNPTEVPTIQPANKIADETAKQKLYQDLEKEIISSAINASLQIEANSSLDEKVESNDEPALEPEKFTSFSSWLKHVSGKTETGKKENQRNIINKFIQNDPQITPKKTEFFSPINMGKLSLAEDEAFVTETLAKIYAKQNNFQKAIKAYEVLQLKYPEKKTFFAAQISEIKKQLNKK